MSFNWSTNTYDSHNRNAERIHAGKEPEIPPDIAACASCKKRIPVSEILRCSACHSVGYCCGDCQKRDWQGPGGGYYLGSHKVECAEIKGYMSEKPKVHAILKQFPWGRIEKNGRFDYLLALALRSLLGDGPEFGWWTVQLYDQATTLQVQKMGQNVYLDTHGGILLSDKHFDEAAGWKLPAEEMPWLTFSEGQKAPSSPPTFEHNWKSYYEWRGLPLKSPAALLLHWPLTVYRLLFLLGFLPSHTGGSARHKLSIHLLGVGAELDCLPIFGELCLLIPSTDIDIVVFGPSVYKLSQNAKPSSIAARKYGYKYRAPEQCGSGSIRIQLYKEAAIWDPNEIIPRKMIPDVLIGLNAGIRAFKTWWPVFTASRALSIPFAVTDHGRIPLAEDLHFARRFAEMTMADRRCWDHVLTSPEKMLALMESLDRPQVSAMNPFMQPGYGASLAMDLMPWAVNGFTCIVTPRRNAG